MALGPVWFHARGTMRAVKRLRRARALWQRVADLVPFTALGIALGAAAVAARAVAFEELDLVLLVLGYGTLGLLVLATTFVLAAALLVKLRLRKHVPPEDPLQHETGRRKPTGFALPALSWMPLVKLRWEWLTPEAEVSLERRWKRIREHVVLRDRGHRDALVRRVVVEDAFGLARLGLRMKTSLPMTVRPHAGKLRRLPTLTSFAGGDDLPHPMGITEGDRVELRRYAPGDPARFIHWKVFARTRNLVVRTPERALQRSQRTVAYLVAGPEDDASAACARVAIESQALGDDWLFGADGAGATRNIAEAVEAIVGSAAHRATGGAGLDSFLRDADRQGPASVVLFVPPIPGPWLDRIGKTLAPRRGRVRLVIGVDGLRSGAKRPALRRLLTRARSLRATEVEQLDEVLRVLSSARVPVLVLDRVSGRPLAEAHRAAVRDPEEPGAKAA